MSRLRRKQDADPVLRRKSEVADRLLQILPRRNRRCRGRRRFRPPAGKGSSLPFKASLVKRRRPATGLAGFDKWRSSHSGPGYGPAQVRSFTARSSGARRGRGATTGGPRTSGKRSRFRTEDRRATARAHPRTVEEGLHVGLARGGTRPKADAHRRTRECGRAPGRDRFRLRTRELRSEFPGAGPPSLAGLSPTHRRPWGAADRPARTTLARHPSAGTASMRVPSFQGPLGRRQPRRHADQPPRPHPSRSTARRAIQAGAGGTAAPAPLLQFGARTNFLAEGGREGRDRFTNAECSTRSADLGKAFVASTPKRSSKSGGQTVDRKAGPQGARAFRGEIIHRAGEEYGPATRQPARPPPTSRAETDKPEGRRRAWSIYPVVRAPAFHRVPHRNRGHDEVAGRSVGNHGADSILGAPQGGLAREAPAGPREREEFRTAAEEVGIMGLRGGVQRGVVRPARLPTSPCKLTFAWINPPKPAAVGPCSKSSRTMARHAHAPLRARRPAIVMASSGRSRSAVVRGWRAYTADIRPGDARDTRQAAAANKSGGGRRSQSEEDRAKGERDPGATGREARRQGEKSATLAFEKGIQIWRGGGRIRDWRICRIRPTRWQTVPAPRRRIRTCEKNGDHHQPSHSWGAAPNVPRRDSHVPAPDRCGPDPTGRYALAGTAIRPKGAARKNPRGSSSWSSSATNFDPRKRGPGRGRFPGQGGGAGREDPPPPTNRVSGWLRKRNGPVTEGRALVRLGETRHPGKAPLGKWINNGPGARGPSGPAGQSVAGLRRGRGTMRLYDVVTGVPRDTKPSTHRQGERTGVLRRGAVTSWTGWGRPGPTPRWTRRRASPAETDPSRGAQSTCTKRWDAGPGRHSHPHSSGGHPMTGS